MAPEVRKRLDAAVKVLEQAAADGAGTASEGDVERATKAVEDGKAVVEKYGLEGAE
jgi:hypothetical protein